MASVLKRGLSQRLCVSAGGCCSRAQARIAGFRLALVVFRRHAGPADGEQQPRPSGVGEPGKAEALPEASPQTAARGGTVCLAISHQGVSEMLWSRPRGGRSPSDIFIYVLLKTQNTEAGPSASPRQVSPHSRFLAAPSSFPSGPYSAEAAAPLWTSGCLCPPRVLSAVIGRCRNATKTKFPNFFFSSQLVLFKESCRTISSPGDFFFFKHLTGR